MADAVEVHGVRQMRAAADQAADAIADTSAADQQAAALVGPVAASTAPRRTGRTAASVRWGASKDGAQVTVGVDWAVPLHWGAPANGQAARPWVAAAWSSNEAAVAKVYEDHADHAVAVFDN